MVNSPGRAIVLLSILKTKHVVTQEFSGRLFVSLVNSHFSVRFFNYKKKNKLFKGCTKPATV